MKSALLLGALRGFGYLPLPIVHGIGALLGWLAWLLPTDARRVSLINLGLCFPDLTERERRRLGRRSLQEAGKTFTELGPMWQWRPERAEKSVRGITNEALFLEGVASRDGVITLIPHLGCWEICNLYYARRVPLTVLYRPPRLRDLDAPIQRWRARAGARLATTSRSGVKTLLRSLSDGEVVGILPDQDPGRGAGVFAPFFGRDAYTMTLVSRLAQRSGARVFTVYGERLSWGRGYRLHWQPVDDEIRSPDLATSVAALNRAIEQCVRACPAQYQWSYKRFKTAPEGSQSPYRKHRPGPDPDANGDGESGARGTDERNVS